MRCPRCGNENPAGNRFCGMCGATLLAPTPAPPQPAHQPPRSAPATTPAPVAAPVEDEPPSIAGPSFLGLNDPAPERKRASFETNPSSRSSNLDYLLDDDVEEPKGGGAGKVFLILLALSAIPAHCVCLPITGVAARLRARPFPFDTVDRG